MAYRMVTLIEVLEAAYGGLERPPAEWLLGVMASLRKGFDQGLGLHGYFVDASRPDTFEVSHWQGLALPDEEAARLGFENWQRLTPVDFKRRVHTFAPFGTGSALPADIAGEVRVRSSAAHGNFEMIGINALDATLRGCAIAAASTVPVSPPHPRLGRLWSRVSVHIATAARLLRRLDQGPPRETAEAVLDPGGKVLDARGDARDKSMRELLRTGATGIDQARTKGARADPERSLELWRTLVAGRWSLIDDFERDGRRFLVAVPNRPELDARGKLSRREREVVGAVALGHSNKLVAYELGLSPTTVATHLSRASAKLGVATRADLVRLLVARPELLTEPPGT